MNIMFLMDGISTLWTLVLGTWLPALQKALSFLCEYLSLGYSHTLSLPLIHCLSLTNLVFLLTVREMPSMGLSGTLSPSVGNLTHLRTM